MPSKAEKGGNFDFPVGSTVTIVDASWKTWEEAGEKALAGGKRKAEDPALVLTGEVEGVEEPRVIFLGAGKATRLVPSRDGEFLDVAPDSSASANSDSSKSNTFLASLCDKKAHGKKTYPEVQLDELPISEALIGLKFIAGSKAMEYNFTDDEGGKKGGSAMIADQILELPKSVGGTGVGATKTKKKAKPAEDEDDDEETDEDETPKKKSKKPAVEEEEEEEEADEKPAKKKKAKGGDADDVTEKTETAVMAVLDNPKYRKGLPEGKAYIAVYSTVKEDDDAEAMMELVKDDDWMQHKDRPWAYDGDESLFTQA